MYKYISIKSKGFTLIELIIVIVLLGVLSVSVLPKYVDLGRDAKVNSLKSIASSIEYTAQQAYMKAKIYGAENEQRSSASDGTAISVNGGVLELKYGYPEVYAEESNGLDIIDLIEVSEGVDICYSDSCIESNSSRVKIGYDIEEDEGCYVKYIEPDGTGNNNEKEYLLEIVDEGC